MSQNQNEKTILIMDDEDMVCDIAEQILEYLGYKVAITRDGLEALELYKKNYEQGCPFGAVIMDLNIPGGVGGKEAVQDILAVDPEAKVIVSSGYGTDPIMSTPQEYGFVASIAKPFEIGAVESLLNDLLS